ncbi:MAG TPA: universal stress protein [Candidatus Limnocylindrales bacterium]|jgi:nucleotide-binding universal stress UspA family protein
MRVLLALDGSPSSLVARDLVASLPWPAGTVIRLLTVNELPATAMGGPPGIVLDPGIVASLAARTAEELDRLGEPLRADGRTIETSVLEGRAASAIVGAAREWTADVVVLGSRGRGPLSTIVLGSVSAEVVERCETAVFVARRATVSRLLVATDGSADAAAIPDDLARWGIFRGLHADVISVVPPREPGFDLLVDLYTLGSYERPAGAREALVEHHRALAADAGDRLAATGIDAAVELADGDPADEILAAATRLHTDLVVTGSRRLHGLDRVLLGSVARNVVFHAHASVLVMGRARSSALPDPGADARRT